jgi:hypothetical protein
MVFGLKKFEKHWLGGAQCWLMLEANEISFIRLPDIVFGC